MHISKLGKPSIYFEKDGGDGGGGDGEPSGGTNPPADMVSRADYEKMRERAQTYEAKATDYHKNLQRYEGVDPDEAKETKRLYDELRIKGAEGDPDKLDEIIREKTTELDSRYAEKFDTLTNRSKELERENNDLKVVSPAMLEAARYFNADALALLKPIISKRLQFKEGATVVVDDRGETRYSLDNPKEPMSVGELMTELVTQYPSAALPKMQSGGGRDGQEGAQDRSGNWSHLTYQSYNALSDEDAAEVPVEVVKRLLDNRQ